MQPIDLYFVVDTTAAMSDRRFISEGWLYHIDSNIKSALAKLNQIGANVNIAILSMGNYNTGAHWIGNSLPQPVNQFRFYGMPSASSSFTAGSKAMPDVSSALKALNHSLLMRPSVDTSTFIIFLLGGEILTDYRDELIKITSNSSFTHALKTAFQLSPRFPSKDAALLSGSWRHVCACHQASAFSSMLDALLTVGCKSLSQNRAVDSAAVRRQALNASGMTPSTNTIQLPEISSSDQDIRIDHFFEGLDYDFAQSLIRRLIKEQAQFEMLLRTPYGKPAPAPSPAQQTSDSQTEAPQVQPQLPRRRRRPAPYYEAAPEPVEQQTSDSQTEVPQVQPQLPRRRRKPAPYYEAAPEPVEQQTTVPQTVVPQTPVQQESPQKKSLLKRIFGFFNKDNASTARKRARRLRKY